MLKQTNRYLTLEKQNSCQTIDLMFHIFHPDVLESHPHFLTILVQCPNAVWRCKVSIILTLISTVKCEKKKEIVSFPTQKSIEQIRGFKEKARISTGELSPKSY